MTCPYITTLERACGRASTHGPFCAFHSVLREFETGPVRIGTLLGLTTASLCRAEARRVMKGDQ